MNIGNTAFYSGDTVTIRHFLQAIFELAVSGVLDEDTFLGRIQHFGLRSIHRFDYDSFALTLDGFIEYMCGLRETVSVNMCLQVLKKLSHGAVSKDNETCIAKLIDMFAELNEHFEAESMHVNRFYLRNLVISLVYFAGRVGGESLKNRVVAALMRVPANGILSLDGAPLSAGNTEISISGGASGHIPSGQLNASSHMNMEKLSYSR